MNANELGLPTYEPEIRCGAYCYGGSAVMNPTDYPQHTDVSEVWVRGSDVAALATRLSEAERDAARYRYLRQIDRSKEWEDLLMVRPIWSSEDIDAAIDAGRVNG